MTNLKNPNDCTHHMEWIGRPANGEGAIYLCEKCGWKTRDEKVVEKAIRVEYDVIISEMIRENTAIKEQRNDLADQVHNLRIEVDRLSKFELTCDGWRDKAEFYERQYNALKEGMIKP